MNRRNLIVAAAVGSVVVGIGALVGLASHFSVLRDDDDDDDEGQEALIRVMRFTKVSLQQGLAAGEQEGQPIAGRSRSIRVNSSSRSTRQRTESSRRCWSTLRAAKLRRLNQSRNLTTWSLPSYRARRWPALRFH